MPITVGSGITIGPGITLSGFTPFQATGGTITTVDIAGTNYTLHTFSTSSNFTVLAGSATVDYLLVGDGRDGGVGNGGGGGGGGVVQGTYAATPGTFAITRSGDSVAFGQTAYIGGSGGSINTNSGVGNPGGSGGGGAGPNSNISVSGGSGTSGQGYGGGLGQFDNTLFLPCGGGGGGAGGGGYDGRPSVSFASQGGIGVSSSITGTATYYGGGGGGLRQVANNQGDYGRGGLGGGGGSYNQVAIIGGNINGTNGLGGGGGGNFGGTSGGTGGTGIVIIRYATQV